MVPSKIYMRTCDYTKLPFENVVVPALSGIGIYLGAVFFLFALSLMSKAGASIIMESWPILTILIAPIALDKKWDSLDIMDVFLIFLSLCGLLFITASEENISLEQFVQNPFFIFNTQDLWGYLGILMALLSAFCFAASSVARAYFAHTLPQDFRIKHFKKVNTIEEAAFTYLLTYLYGFPIALFCFLFLEDNIYFEIASIAPVIFIGFSLTITSALYTYALIVSDNSNINMLWYLSPLLAAIWLAVFGYSQITPMLILGGFFIISANIILIVKSKNQR